jgi:hypothetical protein
LSINARILTVRRLLGRSSFASTYNFLHDLKSRSLVFYSLHISIYKMPTKSRYLYVASLFACTNLLFLEPSFAADNDMPKLRAKMQLTQIAREKWLAEYVFSEPIQGLEFQKAGDYRQSAWKLMSPDVSFRDEGDSESFSAPKGMTTLRFEISSYGKFEPKNYAPNIRFSDGGANIYMGFFHGLAIQKKAKRELKIDMKLEGLPNETLIPIPHSENSDNGDYAYAYFGPQKPVMRGAVQMIIDPALPIWVRDQILDISAIASRYFEEVYQRKLSRPLSLTAAASDFEANGFSFKGGATNGQINYRISGKLVLSEDPEIQAKITKLVKLIAAHEMAHIWQNDVKRGGIGETSPWIHEGGAELMSADALFKTGLWSKTDYDSFIEKNTQECDRLKETENAYRYSYACGLRNFVNYKLDIPTLWKALMLETEKTGEPYSEAMVDRVVAGLRASENK